jgi:hypothetical protein
VIPQNNWQYFGVMVMFFNLCHMQAHCSFLGGVALGGRLACCAPLELTFDAPKNRKILFQRHWELALDVSFPN